MSWSIYVGASTPEKAKEYVSNLKEPTAAEHPHYGTPKYAKDLVLMAIDAAGLHLSTDVPCVKIEASGHQPGNLRVIVEPFYLNAK